MFILAKWFVGYVRLLADCRGLLARTYSWVGGLLSAVTASTWALESAGEVWLAVPRRDAQEKKNPAKV